MRVVIAAAAVLAAGPGWSAPARLVAAQAGKDAPIGVYAVIRRDCSVGAAPDIHITRAPARGTIVVEDVQFPAKGIDRCTLVTVPARRVVYRPASGFAGQDEVMFEIVDRDTGQIDPHPVTIVVQPDPASI